MICYVFKRKRRIGGELVESRTWFGALRMDWEQGATRKWCLGTFDKREAERLLHAERIKVEKRHSGVLPPQEQVDAVSHSLNDLLGAFLLHLREIGRQETTLAKYRNMRVLFTRCRWRTVGDVTARSFCTWRTNCGLSGKSKNDLLKNTCNFFEWMRREGMVSSNPLEFVEPVRLTPTHFRRALTPEQAQRLLSVASPERAVVYLAAMQLGLRRKELQGLTVGDFEFETPAPFVRVPASLSKNRTEATLLLRPEVVAAVKEILPANASPSHKVFAGMVPRLPRFKKDLELAKIPFEDAQGRRVDLHALRVTLGTNLIASGTPLVVVKELMRHSDIKTTLRHYADTSQLPVAVAVANLPLLTVPSPPTDRMIGRLTAIV